ncbi:MAG: hypothetical protein V4864_14665 [Pseudomonadota bacterium]
MLTLRHIKNSTRLKHAYGLHRQGELDHQDAGFDGGSVTKKGHSVDLINKTSEDAVAFEVTLVTDSATGSTHFVVK